MLLQFNGHDAAFSDCQMMRLSVLAAGCWHAEHHFNAAGTLLPFKACFNAAGMMPSLGVAGYRLPVSVAGMVLAFTATFQRIEPDLLLARNSMQSRSLAACRPMAVAHRLPRDSIALQQR